MRERSLGMRRTQNLPYTQHAVVDRAWALTEYHSQAIHFPWSSQPAELDLNRDRLGICGPVSFEEEAQASVRGNEAGDHNEENENLEIAPAELLLNARPNE